MTTDNRTNEPTEAQVEAADAVVTEGQVEEALYKAFQGWDEESDDLFAVQAKAVLSLFRGGAK